MYTGQREKYIATVFTFGHGAGTVGINLTRFLAAFDGTGVTTDSYKVVMTRSGTLKNLSMKASTASTINGTGHSVEVLINGGSAPTPLIVTWNSPGGGLPPYAPPTINTAVVNAGDVVSVRLKTKGTLGTLSRPTVSFELEVDDDYPNPWNYDPTSKIISYGAGSVVVSGEIQSDAGFRFPDGSVQNTAAGTGGAGIDGSGTTNAIPKFATPATLTDSQLYERNGNIGIGTQNPSTLLHIFKDSSGAGSEYQSGLGLLLDGCPLDIVVPTNSVNGIRFHFPGEVSRGAISYFGGGPFNERLSFRIGSTDDRMVITSDGRVGINSPNPEGKLDVDGNTFVRGRLKIGTTPGFWIPGSALNVTGGDVFIEREVGIGSPTPQGKLHVMGGNAIFEGGHVGIGTASPQSKLHVVGDIRFGRMLMSDQEGPMEIFSPGQLHLLNNDGVIVSKEMHGSGNLIVEGDLTVLGKLKTEDTIESVAGFIGPFLSQLSSKRWKTNIEPLTEALQTIQRLQGVSFDWKEDGRHDIGLIAEDVGNVIPEVVLYEKNSEDAKGIDYGHLTAILIEAVKEQQKQIEELKTKVSSLLNDKATVPALA